MSKEIAIQRFKNNTTTEVTDFVAVEEPMEIRIEGRSIAILMRTPGSDIELTLGFLHTEGVIEDRDDIQDIAHVGNPIDNKENIIDTILASGVPSKRRHMADRSLFASSSCGLCGKTSIDRIFVTSKPIDHKPEFSTEIILSLPSKLRKAQAVFTQTGGLHAAGLFTLMGDVIIVREDIGRHNAVDKVIGYFLQRDDLINNKILVVSGRVGFEIAQKAFVAQIPVIVAIGSPSSLAIELCIKANITLFGFVSKNKYNQYS
jgi:FdhD protein